MTCPNNCPGCKCETTKTEATITEFSVAVPTSAVKESLTVAPQPGNFDFSQVGNSAGADISNTQVGEALTDEQIEAANEFADGKHKCHTWSELRGSWRETFAREVERLVRAADAQRIAALQAERDDLKEELQAVLSNWNALVKATGAPTNGTAIGHAAAMRAEVERLRALNAQSLDALEATRKAPHDDSLESTQARIVACTKVIKAIDAARTPKEPT